MSTANTIRDVPINHRAQQLSSLLAKLGDIDANRIAQDDRLVMRKAVFGLLEIVGDLEARVAALEEALAQRRRPQLRKDVA